MAKLNLRRTKKSSKMMKVTLSIFGALSFFAVTAITAYNLGKDNNNELPQETLPISISTVANSTNIHKDKESEPKSNTVHTTSLIDNKKITKSQEIPQILHRPDGIYNLVNIIEGMNENHHLNTTIHFAKKQQRKLTSLTQVLTQTPASRKKERKQLITEISKTETLLNRYRDTLSQKYKYSISNKYLNIPHRAFLFNSATKDKKQNKRKAVHTFESTEQYQHFLKDRYDYLLLQPNNRAKLKQSVSKNKTGGESPLTDKQTNADEELATRRKKLIQLYSYDPKKEYQVLFEKVAFYLKSKPKVSATSPSSSRKINQPKIATISHPSRPKKPRSFNTNSNNTTKKIKNKGVTSSSIAKLKNVPESVINKKDKYSLVCVVEGDKPNLLLRQGIQVIDIQRKHLAKISKQFSETSTKFPQQRELLAGKINTIQSGLKDNLKFMAQKYGYSKEKKHLLIPHKAKLVALKVKNGKTKAIVIHDFTESKSLNNFINKRQAYFNLNKAKTKAMKTLKKAKRKELIKSYRYDPEKRYRIEFNKTAIYAR